MFFDAVAGLRRGRKDSQGRAKTCATMRILVISISLEKAEAGDVRARKPVPIWVNCVQVRQFRLSRD